jgi:hypothetical protein
VDAEPAEALLQKAMAANPDILDMQIVPLAAPASSHHLARTLSV